MDQDPEGRYAIVATTRPETIMGDTAMCINPHDPKNAWLRGKKVVVPLVGRVIPVIEDEYVDIEFGTGCLKVTPAHDVNDYMLGEKHNLPSIDIFNDDGTLSKAAGLYVGMDRFEVRKQIEKDLAAAGLLERVEDYTNKVGFSERTNVPIEPKLSMQWFLRMQHFADMALPPSWRTPEVLPRQIQEHLPQLAHQHQGLVHQPPAVVGAPHPGVVLEAPQLPCLSRCKREEPPSTLWRKARKRLGNNYMKKSSTLKKLPSGGVRPAPGRPRLPRHVVLVVAVAAVALRRHPAPGQRGNQLLLPHRPTW